MRLLSSLSIFRLGVWLIIVGLSLIPLSLVVSLALGGNQIPILLEQGDCSVELAVYHRAISTGCGDHWNLGGACH